MMSQNFSLSNSKDASDASIQRPDLNKRGPKRQAMFTQKDES